MKDGFYGLDQKTQALRGPFDSLYKAEDYMAQLEALISGPRQAEEQAFKVVYIYSDEYAELKVRGTLLQAQLDLTAVWKKRALEAEDKLTDIRATLDK
jgi:hypothetical protein